MSKHKHKRKASRAANRPATDSRPKPKPDTKGKQTTAHVAIQALKDRIAELEAMPVKVEILCEFCEYQFDAECGRYGCPNCNGEGLGEGRLVGFVVIRKLVSRSQFHTFPIIETFGEDGPRAAVDELLSIKDNFPWKAYRVFDCGDSIRFVPHEID